MAEDMRTIKPGRQRRDVVVPPAAAPIAPDLTTGPAGDRPPVTVPYLSAADPAPAGLLPDPVTAATSPAIVHPPIPGPAATSAPTSEGPEDMATIAPPSPAEAADKAQAAFGDASARIKSAFEKSSKIGEELVEFAKGNVEAVLASSRVAAKGAESIGQEAADYSRKSLEQATAAFKSFATVKSPTELFTLQSEFAKASFDSAVAEASKISEALLKLAGDVAQPLSTRYALAADKFKSTTL